MATINEVADAAGVSISTVSYALSGKRPVAAATRERIEAAIADLGYSPHAGARMLAARRSRLFALTEPLRTGTHTPTHMAFVLAIAVAARRNDYDILLLTDEDAHGGMNRVAANGLVDGILVLDVAPDDARAELARQIATPTVFVGVPQNADGLVCVDLDFESATAQAVDRLADAGHTTLGLVGQLVVDYEKSNFPPRVHRSFLSRATERGVAAEFRTTGDVRVSRAATRRAAAELLDAGATALILNANDEAHAGVLAEIDARGLRIPEDVSLISVGVAFDTAALPTPLDTIPLVPQESADLAVDLALRSLDGEPPEPGIRLIAPTYIDRGTIAPPPQAPPKPPAPAS